MWIPEMNFAATVIVLFLFGLFNFAMMCSDWLHEEMPFFFFGVISWLIAGGLACYMWGAS